jgi:hypothetical protein
MRRAADEVCFALTACGSGITACGYRQHQAQPRSSNSNTPRSTPEDAAACLGNLPFSQLYGQTGKSCS